MALAASPSPPQLDSVNVSDLLDPVVIPPNTKFPFPVHFYAEVVQQFEYKKKEKRRIHLPKKKKAKRDRSMLITAKQLKLCSCSSGSEKFKSPLVDISGVVLSGSSHLGIFTPEEDDDLLIEFKNSIARGKAIRAIELLRAINAKPESGTFKVWNLLEDASLGDVIRLGSNGVIGREDYLSPAVPAQTSTQRDRSNSRRASNAPSSPALSSYTSAPSGSPPQSPVSALSTGATSSKGVVTFQDYGSYAEVVSRCKSLEITVSELRGEMSGLKAILEHVNHQKEEGIIQAAKLRQQFEDERTRDLIEEVKSLRAVVASVQSENQSLSRRLSELRHYQSPPTLLSRHVSKGTVPSTFSPPTSSLWSPSGYPIEPNNKKLEEEFDRELIHEKRVIDEAMNYYYPAPSTPPQETLGS